jgi:hypothetical protein
MRRVGELPIRAVDSMPLDQKDGEIAVTRFLRRSWTTTLLRWEVGDGGPLTSGLTDKHLDVLSNSFFLCAFFSPVDLALLKDGQDIRCRRQYAQYLSTLIDHY